MANGFNRRGAVIGLALLLLILILGWLFVVWTPRVYTRANAPASNRSDPKIDVQIIYPPPPPPPPPPPSNAAP
jgi:hypothetical protein